MNTSKQTFRSYVKLVLDVLKIERFFDFKYRLFDIFPKRFVSPPFSEFLFTIQGHGTECPVTKVCTHFHKSYEWFSGYWSDCTAKYLIFISLETGILLGIVGPYFGPESDSSCARDSRICEFLDTNKEFGIGDGKFSGLNRLKVKGNFYGEKRKEFQTKRPLVENVIGYFKHFQIFNSPFRHSKEEHVDWFNSIGNFVFYQTFYFPHKWYPKDIKKEDFVLTNY